MAAKLISCQIVDTNGSPVSGAKVYVYDAGTATPRAIYKESALGTAEANPAIATADGAASVWVDDAGGNIKVVVTSSGGGTTYHSEDAIPISALTVYPVITYQGDQSLATTSSPTFAGLTLGNVAFSGIVTDPNADRLVFWDDSAGALTFMDLGTGLAFDGTTLDLDADLEAISGLTPADGAVIIGDGTTFTSESGATARTSLGLTIGANVLAHDANLQAFVDAFTAPTADGAAGQFITTDGAGTLSFATAAGAGDLLAAADEELTGAYVEAGLPSVDALTARAKPATDGARATVAGYAAAGDGGGGVYVWDASSSATEIVGIIESADSGGTGRWLLQHNGVIDIRQAGAQCDNSTDDSASVAAVMSSGASVWFPPNKTTVIGTGTAIKFTTSFQSWQTAPGPSFDTYLKIGATIQIGNDVTGSEALVQGVSIGDGFYIEDTRTSPSGPLFDLKRSQNVAFGRGKAVELHQFAKLGASGAAGTCYRVRNFMDLEQRYGTVTVADGSSFAAAETITGGTSGATGVISSIDGNVLTVSLTSETGFTGTETITGSVAGSSTFSSQYRPDHLFESVYFQGALLVDATIEGAYDGAADGFHLDSNTYTRCDELIIREYFGRFRRGVSAVDARLVNAHLEADMEGCLENTVRLEVTSSTSKAVGSVGWSNVYFKDVKMNTASPDLVAQAGVWIACNRAGVECETVGGHISFANEHLGHGVFIRAQAGNITGVDFHLTGHLTPRATGYSAVRATEDSGATLAGLRLSANVNQEGANALAAAYNLEGAMQVEFAPPIHSGTVTASVVFGGTPDYSIVNGEQVLRGDGSVSAPAYAFASALNKGFYVDASGYLAAAHSGVQQFYVRSGGTCVVNGSAAAPSRAFIGDPSSGNFRNGSGDPAVSNAGTEVASFPSTGIALPSGNSLKQNGSVRIAEDGGVVIVSANSTNIENAAAAINTTGKHAGKLVWNTSDTAIYTAAGSGATAAWWPADTSLSSITPS